MIFHLSHIASLPVNVVKSILINEDIVAQRT